MFPLQTTAPTRFPIVEIVDQNEGLELMTLCPQEGRKRAA